MPPQKPVALAVAAHPDDIEFMMAGTLLLLKQKGVVIHFWNIANGCCGTAEHEKEEIIQLRSQEAHNSALFAGATLHPPLVDDLMIYYEPSLVAKVTAKIREIQPTLILTHPPRDYMEDHQNTCRLVVSAAFYRGMKNFISDPPIPPSDVDTAIYHCQPHGLRDGLRHLLLPGLYVDITTVIETKMKMLACHQTQKNWLDKTQGMGAYVESMKKMARKVGKLSKHFVYAEGWSRHLHLGLGPEEYDPLHELLSDLCLINHDVEDNLG